MFFYFEVKKIELPSVKSNIFFWSKNDFESL